MSLLFMRLIGIITVRVDGFDMGTVINRLRKECKVISLDTKGDTVYATLPFYYEKKLEDISYQNNCVLEITSRKGVYFHLRKYRKRYGFAVGILVSILLSFYLSNIVFSIRIVGTDDESIIYEVRGILEEEGLKAGAFIPNLNFLKLQTRLFEIDDDISWVSIGNSGSVVTVNLRTVVEKVKTDEGRIPCNIIATEDAQIVDINVLVGHLEILIGDAVAKGDLLVSGYVERGSGRTYYYHSIANITAVFERIVTFEQSIYDRKVVDGETYYAKSLSIFDIDILIPNLNVLSGSYITDTYRANFNLFGIELPIGITTTEYTEQIYKLNIYTLDEAEEIVYEKLENYEENLIGDYEIMNKDVAVEKTDSSVVLTCTYTLKGDIGIESPIFAK
ncbi:MAG: sporulation protein YqfD [Oscillospiraceae bacterium]|nr:sporulation protein YqfD [Oscillospiraceae bacterium]